MFLRLLLISSWLHGSLYGRVQPAQPLLSLVRCFCLHRCTCFPKKRRSWRSGCRTNRRRRRRAGPRWQSFGGCLSERGRKRTRSARRRPRQTPPPGKGLLDFPPPRPPRPTLVGASRAFFVVCLHIVGRSCLVPSEPPVTPSAGLPIGECCSLACEPSFCGLLQR